MRLVSRPLATAEFDHELVWLAVTCAAAVAGAGWLWFGLGFPRCPLLAVTGYPCLTCGATRCAIAFGHGHFFQAFHWNPLALVGICGLLLFDLYAAIVLVAGLPRLRLTNWTRVEKNVARLVGVALIFANWAYLLAHRSQF
jgi:Protein of unknown function (DUF2752)